VDLKNGLLISNTQHFKRVQITQFGVKAHFGF